ncbi:hypothetical protein [Methylobacterium tarhaniae]|nr:hypothetical protein [Methylobacterium tarhaniae]
MNAQPMSIQAPSGLRPAASGSGLDDGTAGRHFADHGDPTPPEAP